MPEIGKIQDEKTEQAVASLQKFEEQLYNKLIVFLAQITHGGTLSATPAQLAQLNNAIVNWTKELGYADIVDAYLKGLDDVDRENIRYYGSQTNKRTLQRIQNEAINSPLTAEYRRQVSDNLRSTGAKAAIVDKIDEVLRLQAIRGMTFDQAALELKALVTTTEGGAGIAERHFKQVAVDAISQYDGVIQERLADRFQPKAGRYLASVIETTRPVCDHIKERFGNGLITREQLRSILNEYCPDGNPSQEKITYDTVNGVQRTAKKGAGMIEGTTLENFAVNRGGYQCRHEWKWDFSTVD